MALFTPGAYGVKADYNYVSTYDLHKPEFAPELVERYGSQYLTELLGMYGRKIPVSSLEYNHFEEDRIMPKVSATSAGAGAGAQATFTLATTSPVQNVSIPQASPYAGSTLTNQGVPVRLNDTILIRPSSGTTSASTYIRAFVDGVNASAGTFTATPLDSGASIPAIGSAQEIFIYGNMFGEGSGQPLSRQSRVIKYTNNLQIIKENYDISNTEKNVVTWIPFTDAKSGRKGYLWTLKGEGDTYKRFLNYREMSCLNNTKLNNVAISNAQASAGTPIKATNGLIPEILAGGQVINYSSITSWTINDGLTMVKALDKDKGAKENLFLAGINLSLDVDTEMRNTFQNGGVVFGFFGDGGKEQAVNMQFDSFQLGNYTFHKKTYDPFNDAQTWGAVGYTYANEAMIIPTDKRMDYQSKEMADSIRVRHLVAPDGSDNREIKHVSVDMFQIDGSDRFECRYVSEIGFEIFASNRFGYFKQF